MDCGCSSTIVLRTLISKPNPKIEAVMQLQMQADNITTNINIKIDLTSPELSTTKIVTWNFHVDYSNKGLKLYMKLSDFVIESDKRIKRVDSTYY